MDPDDEWGRLRSALSNTLSDDPEIDFAVVFGSRVSGTARSSSDIDLAVKFSDDLSSTEQFRKRCFLSGDLQRDDAPFVDVSDIESLPPDVAHEAVNGEFLCGDERTFDTFRERVEARFEAQRDERRQHQRDVIDRIAERGLHG
ncbi:hypothetical protein C479_12304 [Halovivax asiaticus JCM 14624]|uniref:Polymerase beta nucleotidyltransferase domain-containing protein n=1 Tax=Halovivax asiaticus JCM 14624 TaxID=1227490 RepID=M0BEK2_9EURY|nr:nucleotidyltransferase domain-containing protein [Halovivax asiaticus]ELZ08907.1 hypothetical protein C479_12304 [Halovivax asiaticus JCM 14624]